MDPLTIGITGFILLLILIFLGIPVAIVLIAVGFFGMLITSNWQSALSMMTTTPFFIASQYSYTPMPLFVLMGSLIFNTGMGTEIYDAITKWLNKIHGGLGIATTVASTIFGTLTGSSLVTASLFTKVAVPEMKAHGYESGFAHSLTCASGVIGMLIPPSMLAIIYAILAEVSIGKLFIAGIVPGLLTALGFSLVIYFSVIRNPSIAPLSKEAYSLKEKFASLRELWFIVVIAVIMLGGIYTGIFTVTEAGAIGAFAVLVILFFMRRLSLTVLKNSLSDTVLTTTMIFLLIIGATIFSRFITITGLTVYLIKLITESNMAGWSVLTTLMLMYILLGLFLDPPSILCITLPLVVPLIDTFNWDPIYFAVLVIYNMHIGTITPPVGLTLFAAKGSASPEVGFDDYTKGLMPFVGMEVLILLLLAFFPNLAVGLSMFM